MTAPRAGASISDTMATTAIAINRFTGSYRLVPLTLLPENGCTRRYWDSGSAMLSRDLPSASTLSLSSTAAAITRSEAANRYPRLTLQERAGFNEHVMISLLLDLARELKQERPQPANLTYSDSGQLLVHGMGITSHSETTQVKPALSRGSASSRLSSRIRSFGIKI